MKQANGKDKPLIVMLFILAFLSLAMFSGAWLLNGQPQPDLAAGGDLLTAKYAGALERVQQLLASYQTDLFSQGGFARLKAFATLPLAVGQVGKTNPFELPAPPAELLLEQLINSNR